MTGPHRVLGGWDTWAPAIGVSSIRGFHRLLATKPVSSETSKAERRSDGDHGSIWDSRPIALSGYPRGPRVLSETACPKHTSPNFSAETRSRTRCLENPTATAREKIPRMEQTRSETLKLFVVSDDWRRNTLLSSRRSERSWQFSWLRSVVPFPAACPWPVKPNKTLRRGLAWSQRQPPHP